MPRRRFCPCGEPLPAGRRKFCSDLCGRSAAHAAEAEGVGAERYNRVFIPGHPLATKSAWVWRPRLAAFEERGGIAICDASGAGLDWADAHVVDGLAGRIVLCSAHNRVRSFGEFVASGVWGPAGGDRLLDLLDGLMASPCPAAGGVPADREVGTGQNPPLGGSHGSHPPVTVGEL